MLFFRYHFSSYTLSQIDDSSECFFFYLEFLHTNRTDSRTFYFEASHIITSQHNSNLGFFSLGEDGDKDDKEYLC